LTSKSWVEKPGAMPPALTEAVAVIGPPVSDFLATSSFGGDGEKSPTLLRGLGLTVLPHHAIHIDIPD
jgi:hypothetical protein